MKWNHKSRYMSIIREARHNKIKSCDWNQFRLMYYKKHSQERTQLSCSLHSIYCWVLSHTIFIHHYIMDIKRCLHMHQLSGWAYLLSRPHSTNIYHIRIKLLSQEQLCLTLTMLPPRKQFRASEAIRISLQYQQPAHPHPIEFWQPQITVSGELPWVWGRWRIIWSMHDSSRTITRVMADGSLVGCIPVKLVTWERRTHLCWK